jgi:MoxR-like ATPase
VNVWLTGPAGTGKTTAAKNVADALGLPFKFTGSIDTEYKLLGFVDAQGRVVNTEFRDAFVNGGVFLFDEVDSSLPAALLAFNAALANPYCAFPDGIKARHNNFVAIAAANTWGLGATNDYVGRCKLDAAFLDRFQAKIHWGIDEELETAISGNEEWAKRVQKFRAVLAANPIKGVMITPRASIGGTKLLAEGFTRSEVEEMTMRCGMTDAQWAEILNRVGVN